MVFTFYIVLNIIAIILFIKYKKNLHIFEIFVYWLVSTYIFQNFSALCYMNFKTLLIPEKLDLEFTHFLNRTILFPILMVTFLLIYTQLSTSLKKLLLVLCFILLLTGFEWLAHLLGVVIHVNWRLWWSFAFWLSALLTLIGFMKFFRKILFKGARYL